MWAVIEINKKQYIVEKGETIKVNRLSEVKKILTTDKVLLMDNDKEITLGNPYIKGAKAKCEVLGEEKGKKVIVYKYERRKKYRKKQGARQTYTLLKITDISLSKS